MIERCPHKSPGGFDKEGNRLPRKGTQCGDYKDHDGDHTILIPTDAPWFELKTPNKELKKLGRIHGR